MLSEKLAEYARAWWIFKLDFLKNYLSKAQILFYFYFPPTPERDNSLALLSVFFCYLISFNPIRRILIYILEKEQYSKNNSNIDPIRHRAPPSHFSNAHNTLFLSSLWRKRKREREEF